MSRVYGAVLHLLLFTVVQGCDEYTVKERCSANIPPHCWNPSVCACGSYPRKNLAVCGVSPCEGVVCSTGTHCEVDYCGGCFYRCEIDSTAVPGAPPTPLPAPTPACTPTVPPQSCSAGIPPHCYSAASCDCGSYPRKSESLCGGNPCDTASCGSGRSCVPNYCGGCYHLCVPTTPQPPVPTPQPTTTPTPTAAPPVTPIPAPTPPTPPTPTPPQTTPLPPSPKAPGCTPYTQTTLQCPSGQCYSFGTCTCTDGGLFSCKRAPCTLSTAQCDEGYYCEDSYCGGCNHRCVQIPTSCSPYTLPIADSSCGAGRCYNPADCECQSVATVSCTGNDDPCRYSTCAVGYTCRAHSCGECSFVCERTSPGSACALPPQTCTGCWNPGECDCGIYDLHHCEGSSNPCLTGACGTDHCDVNICGGCWPVCTPRDPQCTPYTPEERCVVDDGPGACWNPDRCVCRYEEVSWNCDGINDPCINGPCGNDHCDVNRCGGCWAVCTPRDPTCTAYTPEERCVVDDGHGACWNPDRCVCRYEEVAWDCDGVNNPCINGPCGDDHCDINRCGACRAVCTPRDPQCTAYTPEERCVVDDGHGACWNPDRCVCRYEEVSWNCEGNNDPCINGGPCGNDHCDVSRCGGCWAICTPRDPTCTAYTPAPIGCPGSAGPGACWNPDRCVCRYEEHHTCEGTSNPCRAGACGNDHCDVSRCGGCWAICTPRDPTCTAYTPAPTGCPGSAGPGACWNPDRCVCRYEEHHNCDGHADPCIGDPCGNDHCDVSRCGGCWAICTARDPQCTPYTPAPTGCPASAGPGACWNPDRCRCKYEEHFTCDGSYNPCTRDPCAAGYECVLHRCGGCFYTCEASVAVKALPPPPPPTPCKEMIPMLGRCDVAQTPTCCTTDRCLIGRCFPHISAGATDSTP